MTQKIRKHKVDKYTTEVIYELNGGEEDAVHIFMEKYVWGWDVETVYNSNKPYSFSNKEKTATFENAWEAKKEVSRRARAWEAKFKKLIL
ncbi:MAG: hypothetical protein GY928_26090 [Colwellia sp.]|nr:hypothetical protein [Colwellia sp.]